MTAPKLADVTATGGFRNPVTGENVTPGTVIGHRASGAPIYKAAGGSGEGGDGGSGGDTGDGGASGGAGEGGNTGGDTGGNDGQGGAGAGSGKDPMAGVKTRENEDPTLTGGDDGGNAGGDDGGDGDGGKGKTGEGKTGEGDQGGNAMAAVRKELREAKAARRAADEQAAKTAKQFEELTTGFARLLGLTPDDDGSGTPPDPTEITRQLQAEQASRRDVETRLAIFIAASQHGEDGAPIADGSALVDSSSFMSKAKKLDPAADDYGDKLAELIKEAAGKNARFQAAKPAAPRQTPPAGGSFGSGPGGKPAAESMSIDDHRAELRKERGLKD